MMVSIDDNTCVEGVGINYCVSGMVNGLKSCLHKWVVQVR